MKHQTIESLERRTFLSVTAASLVGSLDKGATQTFDVLQNGSKIGTSGTRVVGGATVGSNATTKVETTQSTTVAGVTGTTTSDQYVTLNDDGFVVYKITATIGTGDSTTTSSTKLTPKKINYPSKLVAGKTYTFEWTELATSQFGSSPPTLTRVNAHYTVKLVSNTPTTVNVPAGRFSAYKIVITSNRSINGGSADDATQSVWAAPGIGTVKFIAGAFTQVLRSYTTGSRTTSAVGSISTNTKNTFSERSKALDDLIE